MNTSCKTYAVALALFFSPVGMIARNVQIVGKKLEGENVKLPLSVVNTILKKNGMATVRMVLAKRTAGNIIDSVDEYKDELKAGKASAGITVTRKVAGRTEVTRQAEEEFIQESIGAIIEPVEVFIDALKKQEKELRPIIEKSLGEGKAPRLMKYFKQSGNFKEIVKKDITTVDELKSVCEDLEQLFADIFESLSPDARKAYDDMMAKVAEKSKKK